MPGGNVVETPTTQDAQAPATPESQSQNDAADEAAFEAGFNGNSEPQTDAPKPKAEAATDGEPAPETKKEEPKKKGQKEDKPETPPSAPAEDPWAGVPPAMRQQFDNISKRFDAIQHHLKSTDGRLGAMQKALTAAKADASQAGAQAPTQQQIAQATTTEKWKKLEDAFPEWAAALTERMAAERAAILAEVGGKMPKPVDVTGTVTPLLENVKAEARALARIDFKHEGWEDTVKTEEFGDWLSKQPADVQKLADSNNAADAIRLLDAFKEASKPQPAPTPDPAKQKQQQQQTRRLEQAVTPQGAGRSTPPALSDDDAFEAGFYGGQRKTA